MKKYQYVYNKLVEQIDGGLYLVGDKLPSEISLAEQFQVSKNTLRKALSLLIENGYISSRHGSGYYITDHKNFNILKLKTLGVTYQYRNVTSKILKFEIIHAGKIEAQNLGIDENEAIFSIKRVRYMDDKPTILENTIVPVRLFPSLTREVFEGSFYEYIANETPHKVDRAIKDISPINPSPEICQILELEHPKPLLTIENYVYLSTGEQFEYSYNIHLDEKISLPISI